MCRLVVAELLGVRHGGDLSVLVELCGHVAKRGVLGVRVPLRFCILESLMHAGGLQRQRGRCGEARVLDVGLVVHVVGPIVRQGGERIRIDGSDRL